MTYRVTKRMEISGAHHLELTYPSKCGRVHGHNWIVTVTMESEELDENGMVMDFTRIKEKVSDRLDHQDLNAVLGFNPTAENIARWIAEELGPLCVRVQIQESEGNVAEFCR